jgi:sterol desaturase/sphingolipid hydroxylase (fatty acid hydroxylase superfamily)
MEVLKNNFQHLKGIVLLILILLVIAEIIWSWSTNKKTYELKDTFANISIFIGFQISKLLFFGLQYSMLNYLANYSILKWNTTKFTFLLTLLSVDFVYYWYHRLSHKIHFLWAFHLIHHSSLCMNLTVSYRLNWLNAILTPFVLTPLVLIGFPIEYIILSFAINLLFQFFLHTEVVGKLGILEGILATPSAHRVHHGSNAVYIDKNFGGILMIWDKLFGTYQKETETPVYGTTKGFISNNPFVLNFKGFVDYFKGKMDYKG